MNHPLNKRHPAGFPAMHRRNIILDVSGRDLVRADTDSAGAVVRSLTLLATLEAVLFLAKEPLPIRRLAHLAELPEGTKTKRLLYELNEQYAATGASFHIVEVAGGYQLRTRPEFASYLVRMQEVPTTVKLTQQAMETLMVIAYKQPVSRTDIELVRGVQCSDLIKQLLDMDLVKIASRSNELGRPFLYGTTKKFLQVFGLNTLGDLPDTGGG